MGSVVIPNTWIVTTEGDCEGKSPDKRLGIFTGPIDRIAFALGPKAEYTLHFEPVMATPAEELPLRSRVVHVQLPDDVVDPAPFFRNRPLSWTKGSYYHSWKLTASSAYEDEFRQSLAKEAANKLSPEEYAALRDKILSEG